MNLQLAEASQILERTPALLDHRLRGLPAAWLRATEGGQTWSSYDVVGHLIHGELTDWVPRIRIILDSGESRTFDPFDRFAQFQQDQAQPVESLLDRFRELRERNLTALRDMRLSPGDFGRRGVHPALGVVTLGQLISTWVVHDLSHLSQVDRILAKQYAAEVGPWKAYLRILQD